ncbi:MULTISPECIES: hypothetical protein [Rhodococcus]|uniref:Lipoprotein n=1 Tax=Rhodococcus oxybenzonivorans TaxID=1990687 RepID=A0AAE4V3D4_9NOCA|nr:MULTISPECIES: hypothetical protein [Rhodococcus]MDV7245222.1 hypothetical protein [Rhodococcus oxybenzonivorans]MDV7267595.1 hypothetical protein [Rhodococcus oxybenzonivorans]MDV7272498.1 hypothetical protein [Rhodococcus oxybenzonivorans]MDV7336247.1 hypothetical protein [Rhodococcus oxybenzonivorans]MDV7342932.1 hypothetical protein [Rhodococcus oxybenzonivorans]
MKPEQSLVPLVVAIVLIVAGCGSSESEPPAVETVSRYSVPDNVGFNYRWSADPGIDLLSRPAVTIRAYMESYYLAIHGQALSAGYPGFADATSQQRDRVDFDHSNDPELEQLAGTQFEHLLALTPTEDGWVATVCSGNYTVMAEKDGRFFNLTGPTPQAETVRMVAPEQQSVASERIVAEGAERAPSADVFAGWAIIEHEQAARDQNAYAECDSRMPDARDVRPQKANLPHDTPYPTLAPYPGWPRYEES